jgi:hypothetical protein
MLGASQQTPPDQFGLAADIEFVLLEPCLLLANQSLASILKRDKALSGQLCDMTLLHTATMA